MIGLDGSPYDSISWSREFEETTRSVWDVMYDDPLGGTAAVEDFQGLTLHLEQQPGYDGDLTSAVNRFAAGGPIWCAPMTLVTDLIGGSYVGLRDLPRIFTRPARPSRRGMAESDRREYVFRQCGDECAYCGTSVTDTYELPLRFAVDHIIPEVMILHGYRKSWIDTPLNLVASCPTCHDLGAGFQFDYPTPRNKNGFFDLRDRVFVQRKARIAVRRAEKSDASTS
jgi:hypothetical protein